MVGPNMKRNVTNLSAAYHFFRGVKSYTTGFKVQFFSIKQILIVHIMYHRNGLEISFNLLKNVEDRLRNEITNRFFGKIILQKECNFKIHLHIMICGSERLALIVPDIL